jgi:hypothetical protein
MISVRARAATLIVEALDVLDASTEDATVAAALLAAALDALKAVETSSPSICAPDQDCLTVPSGQIEGDT